MISLKNRLSSSIRHYNTTSQKKTLCPRSHRVSDIRLEVQSLSGTRHIQHMPAWPPCYMLFTTVVTITIATAMFTAISVQFSMLMIFFIGPPFDSLPFAPPGLQAHFIHLTIKRALKEKCRVILDQRLTKGGRRRPDNHIGRYIRLIQG